MKLQKQLSRKYEGKDYPKYVVAIPPKQVEQAGWKEGIELEAQVEGDTIIIKPKTIGNE
jgi:bifunctional DNA-binding transcriptional regulator/antitoxin component of YhaV-PrlF toxin-antitoxin module